MSIGVDMSRNSQFFAYSCKLMSEAPKKCFSQLFYTIFQCLSTTAFLLYAWREREGEKRLHSPSFLPSLFPPRHRQMCCTGTVVPPSFPLLWSSSPPDVGAQKKYTKNVQMWKKKIECVLAVPYNLYPTHICCAWTSCRWTRGRCKERGRRSALLLSVSRLIDLTEQINTSLVSSFLSYREPHHLYI